jgi:FlaA1/EpsC-like NDP-sugar epimerase
MPAEPISRFKTRLNNEGFNHKEQRLYCFVRRRKIFKFLRDGVQVRSQADQVISDSGIIALSFAASYLIRFEGVPPSVNTKQFLVWLPILLAARLLVNWRMGVYRFIWRFVCLSDARAVTRSLVLVTLLLLVLRLFYPLHARLSAWLHLPLSVIVLESLLSLSGCLGARVVSRILYERSQGAPLCPGETLKRVVLYGAGRAGILLSKELLSHSDIKIVGFVDDDPMKVGTVISGIRVLGTGESLDKIVRHARVNELMISIATVSPESLARILLKCEQIPVSAKIIPSLQELLSRNTQISHVREIRIEDLLGRGSVEIGEFDSAVRQAYAGKRILVTGAGGSIGRELVRQLLLLHPCSVAILDKDENSIYELDQELKFRCPDAGIEPVIADVRNRDRVHAIFAEFKPEVVFHAAAHKHVPLMEKHPCEAVLNNICGSRNLLEACRQYGVERFVFISSDKAVNPTNIMGATKKVGEKLVQAYAKEGHMRLACVRFGNVMGSRGSVVPLFQRQIAAGGPITITHPDIVRFFMTIPEAVQLVLCAGSLADQGEIFVLEMGSPRKILDLAHQLVRLFGLEPGKDIQIAITGLRPGEKMYEELVGHNEQISPTRFEKVSMIGGRSLDDGESFLSGVESLVSASQRNDFHAVLEILSDMGLGFTPSLSLHASPQRPDYVASPLLQAKETCAVPDAPI